MVCDPAISAATNRISESGYSYDANGSLTANAAGERFGYDGESHQTEFFAASNQGSTPDAVYTYDGEGRRVKKVSAAETTIFVYDASGVLIAEYSGEVAAEPRVSYLTTDHLGSPRVVTDKRRDGGEAPPTLRPCRGCEIIAQGKAALAATLGKRSQI
ncbi:MAG TPA: hypothetical protein PKC65_06085 [Pyrinomonadaceae bacterium]|nr:hypothetical protein [Pyrinomonadaceae bacterium]